MKPLLILVTAAGGLAFCLTGRPSTARPASKADPGTDPVVRQALLEEARTYERWSDTYLLGGSGRCARYAMRARDLYRQALGDEVQSSREYAGLLETLGFSSYLQNPRTAEEPYVELLQIRRRMHGELNADYARPLAALGSAYDKLHRFARAEDCLRRAVRIYKQVDPGSHGLGNSLLNLGTLLIKVGKLPDAQQVMVEGAGILVTQETTDSERARIHCLLTDLYIERGEYSKALDELTVAQKFEEQKKMKLKYSPRRLGVVYLKQKDYARGEALLKNVLDEANRWENKGGELYAYYALPLCQLYMETGRYDEAKELLDRAIGALEEAFGLDHHALVEPLSLLVKCHRQAGAEHEEAKWLEKRATDIQAAWKKQEAEDIAALAKERSHN